MNQWSKKMIERTHRFAVDIVLFVKTLPRGPETDRLKSQLVGAAMGVAGNYRSACRSRSHREFTSRLAVVLEEVDESEGWLDLIYDSKVASSAELDRLRGESKELRAVFARSVQTARTNGRMRQEP